MSLLTLQRIPEYAVGGGGGGGGEGRVHPMRELNEATPRQ